MAIEILDGGTIAGLRRVADQLTNTRPLLIQVGFRANVELRAWFVKRNLAPSKIEGHRSDFWRAMASSVAGPTIVGAGKVRVSVTDYRFNQKVFGGRITPKRAGALTIPIAPESRGLTVKVFERETGIKLFLLKKTGGALTNLLAGALPAGGVKVFYVLSKGVDQDPDPEALPPRDKFNAALLDEADQTLRRSLNSDGGSRSA